MSLSSIKPGQLRRFVPFEGFSPESIIVAAGQAELVELNAGDELITFGSTDDHDYFLINGEVHILDVEGNERELGISTKESCRPIAPLRPSVHTVTANSYARCVRIPREVIEILNSQQTKQGASVDDITHDLTQTQEFFSDFSRDLSLQQVSLPACPDLAKTIRRAIESKSSSSQDVARVISVDPAIAARVLKIANSPIFRGQRAIEDLHEAVTRIGLHTVGELVVCFTLRETFKSKLPNLRKHLRENLEEAVHVAALCEHLCRDNELPWHETATVAGLIHNIGSLPIINYAGEHPAFQSNPDVLKRARKRFAPEVGEQLARDWQLGDNYQQVLRQAHDWRYDAKKSDLTSLVIAARLIFAVKRVGFEKAKVLGEIPAILLVCGEPLSETSARDYLARARESVTSLQSFLSDI